MLRTTGHPGCDATSGFYASQEADNSQDMHFWCQNGVVLPHTEHCEELEENPL